MALSSTGTSNTPAAARTIQRHQVITAKDVLGELRRRIEELRHDDRKAQYQELEQLVAWLEAEV